MKTFKIIDDKGNIKKVTERAWEVLYKDRKGYKLYVETNPVKKEKVSTKTSSSPKKKVAKDDNSK